MKCRRCELGRCEMSLFYDAFAGGLTQLVILVSTVVYKLTSTSITM